MVKSVYIHIPFCKKICSYCDFCKVFYNKEWVNKYLKALKKEIKDNYKGETISNIYIGGGTPSSLDINELNILFDIIKLLNINEKYEFTIECNIEDITEDKLILFKNNNVNRISIGIESFNNKYLKFLNRNYKEDIIYPKIELVKKFFKNISIDLIYALPNQTLFEVKEDIDKALKLDVNHISCYSLIIENNTRLKIDNVKQIDDDLDYKMYLLINDILKEKYNRYEISNYSKKGFESKSNLTYWNNEEYYGFGLSASGYINNIRYTNTKNLSKYLNNIYDKEEEILNIDDKIKYEIILGLRKKEGINKETFYNKYNINLLDVKNIKELIDKNYLCDNKKNIYINEKYTYVINDILINFI